MAGGKKEHVVEVRESKFNRQRAETAVLRKNCGKDGYVFAHKLKSGKREGEIVAAGQCEFHHAMPISSMQDGSIMGDSLDAEKKGFIRKCMAITTWDINKRFNLIGLPTKGPYGAADKAVADEDEPATLTSLRALKAASGHFGALPDLPCHLNDHPAYTKSVIDKLDKDLWPKLLKGRKDCKDKGKNIRKMLLDECRHWKEWVIKRGAMHDGAADCWVNREQKKDVWFIPLSMHPKPPKIDPPPNVYVVGGKRKAWLKTFFGAIK